jgi:hypothetical protein
MDFLYFYDLGPFFIKTLLGVLLLKYIYVVWAVSRQASAEIKAKADEGFDKEAFYAKYRKIYEAMTEEERAPSSHFHSKEEPICIPPRKPRYEKEYQFFISCTSPFEILGIPQGSSLAQIKKRYRQLAYKWHPDRFGGKHLSSKELQQITRISQIINLAYETLVK